MRTAEGTEEEPHADAEKERRKNNEEQDHVCLLGESGREAGLDLPPHGSSACPKRMHHEDQICPAWSLIHPASAPMQPLQA